MSISSIYHNNSCLPYNTQQPINPLSQSLSSDFITKCDQQSSLAKPGKLYKDTDGSMKMEQKNIAFVAGEVLARGISRITQKIYSFSGLGFPGADAAIISDSHSEHTTLTDNLQSNQAERQRKLLVEDSKKRILQALGLDEAPLPPLSKNHSRQNQELYNETLTDNLQSNQAERQHKLLVEDSKKRILQSLGLDEAPPPPKNDSQQNQELYNETLTNLQSNQQHDKLLLENGKSTAVKYSLNPQQQCSQELRKYQEQKRSYHTIAVISGAANAVLAMMGVIFAGIACKLSHAKSILEKKITKDQETTNMNSDSFKGSSETEVFLN